MYIYTTRTQRKLYLTFYTIWCTIAHIIVFFNIKQRKQLSILKCFGPLESKNKGNCCLATAQNCFLVSSLLFPQASSQSLTQEGGWQSQFPLLFLCFTLLGSRRRLVLSLLLIRAPSHVRTHLSFPGLRKTGYLSAGGGRRRYPLWAKAHHWYLVKQLQQKHTRKLDRSCRTSHAIRNNVV